MALVKCPKCGEFVSSTAAKCVHCGASFHGTCFECGSLMLAGEKACRKCGANQNAMAGGTAISVGGTSAPVSAFQVELKEEPTDGISEAEGAKIEAEMTSIIQKRKDRDKKIFLGGFLCAVPAFLFIMIPLFIILKKGSDMAELPSYMRTAIWSESSVIVLFMLIIGAIFLIADGFIRAYTSLNQDKKQAQEMESLGKEKWRYYIKQNASKTRDKNEQAAFDKVLRIGYFLENPEKKENPTLSIIRAVIGGCTNAGWSILIVVFLYGSYRLCMGTGIDVLNLFGTKIKDLVGPILMLIIVNLPFGIIGLVFESKTKKEIKLYQESILAEENN